MSGRTDRAASVGGWGPGVPNWDVVRSTFLSKTRDAGYKSDRQEVKSGGGPTMTGCFYGRTPVKFHDFSRTFRKSFRLQARDKRRGPMQRRLRIVMETAKIAKHQWFTGKRGEHGKFARAAV